MNKLLNWFDDRTGIRDLMHEALFERIPGGARWRYVWGSTLVFTFSIQVITGLFLWTAYSPSAQTAWESVYYIQDVMYMGNIVRGIHHYSSSIMVVLMAIHLMQVIIDGAYKAPREINFWLGLILLQIVLALSLTGYLLPWDQKGYYATQVTTKIMGAAPIIGPQIQELVQGGPEYGHHTLTRFFAMHAGVLPGLLMLFLGLHIYIFRRHGITTPDPDRAPETTFWPDQVLKDAVACLGVLAVVLGLAIFKGAELSGPANPSEAYSAARPEWYFLFLFRFLRFEVVEHIGAEYFGGLAFGAIYVPGVLMGIIALMPIIAWWKGGHRFNLAFMWAIAIGVGVLTGMAFYDDDKDVGHQAAIAEANRDAERVRELARRPSRIPVEGAGALLRDDPFTQGPRIFAKYCSSCHRYNGHNGRGRMVLEQLKENDKNGKEVSRAVASIPTGADLGNFGSGDWWKSLLLDYENHVGGFTKIEGSEMADWSKDNRKALQDPKNADDVKAIYEYLASLSARPDRKYDPKLVEKGRKITTGDEFIAVGEFASCTDCHDSLGAKFKVTGDGFGYPDIADYGSKPWLTAFILDPGSDQFYGDDNKMQVFKGKISDRELDLLVRWMTGDYYETEVEDYESKVKELEEALQARKGK
jgi:ubiquinol-cytochrome c reductase cytochrome b subunit